MGDRYTDIGACREMAHKSTRAGTVQEKVVIATREDHWDHIGRAIRDKTHVADQSIIHNLVDRVSLVNAARRLSPDTRSFPLPRCHLLLLIPGEPQLSQPRPRVPGAPDNDDREEHDAGPKANRRGQTHRPGR